MEQEEQIAKTNRVEQLKLRLINHPVYHSADADMDLQNKLEAIKEDAMKRAIEIDNDATKTDSEKNLAIAMVGDQTEQQFQLQVGLSF